jgi:hypothetical protein
METTHHIDNLVRWLGSHPQGQECLPGTPTRIYDAHDALVEYMEDTVGITIDKAGLEEEISEAERAASVAEGEASDLRDLWTDGSNLLRSALPTLRGRATGALVAEIEAYLEKQPG